ncbi:uncharacterized protein LOC126845716 [Adelges cooleyi]|uniref:uncharacterized protein LOC126845716 n=1 Tax=Adelges cooleyi TaxID=133065 RepID=UPI00217F26A6|nr:uncharacterized protein LOC126845716 [Adelges cooleyi]
MSRKSNLLVKNTSMSLHDRFTQIQQKAKSVGEEDLIRKRHRLSLNMERRPELPSTLFMNQEYPSRECLRVPPPILARADDCMFSGIMRDIMRPVERVNIPVHERLALNRVPLVEERSSRRSRRRRGTKAKSRGSVKALKSDSNPTEINKPKNKNRTSKQRDAFPRKEHPVSKEDLDKQLDQFMSHTKQKRDEELSRVINKKQNNML